MVTSVIEVIVSMSPGPKTASRGAALLGNAFPVRLRAPKVSPPSVERLAIIIPVPLRPRWWNTVTVLAPDTNTCGRPETPVSSMGCVPTKVSGSTQAPAPRGSRQ